MHFAAVLFAPGFLDESTLRQAVHEFDGAVVPELELLSEKAMRGPASSSAPLTANIN